jgi:hypothetical protein
MTQARLRTGLVCMALVSITLGQRAPEGRVPETIDYANPSRYAKIPARDGESVAIGKISDSLSAKDPEQVMRKVHAFIADRVPHVPEGWLPDHRNFHALVAGFDHGGCASHALLFANLLRARGIPAVYVKSARHEWIRDYVAAGTRGSFAGHVFLEVFVADRWKLLDAQGMEIWDDYDPRNPELPGGLLAYEKGWDHFAMVHSTRRDLFIREALARWKGFDVSTLRPNTTPGRPLLPKCFALTRSGEWKVLAERLSGLCSFNGPHWSQKKAEVRGNILIVTSLGGRTDMPVSDVEAWLPASLAQLEAEAHAGESKVRTRRLDDGTLVVLVSAPGWAQIMSLLWTTDFERIRCDDENAPSTRRARPG